MCLGLPTHVSRLPTHVPGDSIFFAAADGRSVYVNQFVSATVQIAPGFSIVQEPSYVLLTTYLQRTTY